MRDVLFELHAEHDYYSAKLDVALKMTAPQLRESAAQKVRELLGLIEEAMTKYKETHGLQR